MMLDLATRTLFAEFQEGVYARAALERDLSTVQTYVRKRVKGSVYWYRQRYEEGQYKQQYFGPSNAKNDAHVEKERKELRDRKRELRSMMKRELRLVAMLRRGGLPVIDKRLATVLASVSASGLLDEGGMLVGTLAYAAYVGMLGVILEKASLKTQDIDVVRDCSVEIALAQPRELKKALAGSGRTFRVVPSLNAKQRPSSLISSDGIRVDLLAVQKGRPRGVVPVKGLRDMGALQLPFLDFLMETPVLSVLLGPSGGIPVRVPDPSRFAVHKLIVAARRSVSESGKSKKDLVQAEQLLRLLADERPHELKVAFRRASRLGKKWAKYLKDSIATLPDDVQNIISSL